MSSRHVKRFLMEMTEMLMKAWTGALYPVLKRQLNIPGKFSRFLLAKGKIIERLLALLILKGKGELSLRFHILPSFPTGSHFLICSVTCSHAYPSSLAT